MTLLLLLAPLGCEPPGAARDPAEDPAADRVRAAFALAEAGRDLPDGPPDDGSPDDDSDRRPDPDCPRCGGTGEVPSGDGLARVPCGCLRGEATDDAADAATKPGGAAARAAAAPRVLVFSAGWCPACVRMTPAVAAAGAGFEVIDADANPAAVAAYGVTALPTLVRLVGGRETARTTGPRDVSGLRRFRDEGR